MLLPPSQQSVSAESYSREQPQRRVPAASTMNGKGCGWVAMTGTLARVVMQTRLFSGHVCTFFHCLVLLGWCLREKVCFCIQNQSNAFPLACCIFLEWWQIKKAFSECPRNLVRKMMRLCKSCFTVCWAHLSCSVSLLCAVLITSIKAIFILLQVSVHSQVLSIRVWRDYINDLVIEKQFIQM